MREKIKAIEEYLKHFPNDTNAKDNLELCKYSQELGFALNGSYYPKIEWKYCLICPQIKAGKNYTLTNSTTKYKPNGNDTIVIWSEARGRLAFVDSEYWHEIGSEWNEFMNVLKSYEPLDYDYINNVYIYDVEHGKRLINDYKKIVNDFMEKSNKKIKEIKIAKKKRQLEMLQKELEEDGGDD